MKAFVIFLALVLVAGVATAQSAYRIQPGDRLDILVLEDPNLNRQALVRPDGGISLLIAGDVQAAGRTVPQLQQAIADRLSSNFAVRPTVSVALLEVAERQVVAREAKTIDVYLVGQVEAPGLKELKPGTTILQAIAQGGGLGRFAATKRIQLRRVDAIGQELVYTFNYNAVQNGAASSGNLVMRAGDVIVVPERRLFE